MGDGGKGGEGGAVVSLAAFKRGLREGFLRGYGAAVCMDRGCFVCGREGEGGRSRSQHGRVCRR